MPSEEELRSVSYTPLVQEDWPVSTPAEQGIDSLLLAKLYYKATRLETTFSLLVIKNGFLIAEDYFNGATTGQKYNLQSVTKSFTSALVGIAIEQGYLALEDKMMNYFPELKDQVRDERKFDITIEHLLQMRAGFAWEESSDELFEILYTGFRPSTILQIPLTADPGTKFQYSNFSAHLLGIIITRSTGKDLKTFAEQELAYPLGIEIGKWIKDWEAYYLGFAELHLSARDLAKFALLYLNEEKQDSAQLVSKQWVFDSLQRYSEDAWQYRVGRNFKDIGYGYQWWSIRADDQFYNLAWGHGGQQIALLEKQNMVIVLTADPLRAQHGGGPWRIEKANLNLIADFIAELSKSAP
ncbi:MAG: serine hydrolase [Balneolaceae bacterium]|nr:serine hydrolase [Balneolaceae bacterium]